MMDAVQRILCNLQFGGDNIADQVMAHLCGPDTVRPVLRVLALLSTGWPDAEATFRRVVVAHPTEWLDEVARMPVTERLLATLATMQAFGGPPPDVLEQIRDLAGKAERELERRGIKPRPPY